jgi:uncharacterized protein YjiK
MKIRKAYYGLAALLLVASVVAAQEFRLFERAWFQWREWRNAEQWQAQSRWLPDYRVEIEAQPIAGLDDELSALTYDPDRNSLFSVASVNPRLVELSLDGRLLRTIPLRGFGDPEAIEYIGPGEYVIADERGQRLMRIQLEEDSELLDAADDEQLTLAIGEIGNKGFEGLAYDATRRRLLAGKERDPIRIYEISGFPSQNGERYAVQVLDNPERDASLFMRDLSGLDYEDETGHLLALSDESRLVIELDELGKPISTLSLWRGRHGLRHNVPQAEGIATDPQGNLYLISEPNLFYKFSKPPAKP